MSGGSSANAMLAAFRRWDADGDGTISREELAKVLCLVGIPEKQIDEVFACADANKDGKIDYEEFFRWLYSKGDSPAALRSLAKRVVWPPGPAAILAPKGMAPDKLKLDAPTPCAEDDISYWSAGGPAKVRVRVVEDAGVLKLGKEFTVGLRFRVGRGKGGSGYDTLVMGHEGKHWLAIDHGQRRLCCVDGKRGVSTVLDHVAPCDEWVLVFLQPRGDKTACFTVDAEGLVEVGLFDVSLVGSRLDKMGWADNEVHIAEVALYTRLAPWREMAAALPSAASPPPPQPSAPSRPRSAFRGQVVDLSGHGLPDVKVNWGKGGCLTDEDGCFTGSISDDETDVPDDASGAGSLGSAASTGSTVVSFSCDGFAPMSAHAQCTPGGPEASLSVTLRQISASSVLDVSKGGSVVDKATGSSVSVPPNALAYPDGSPVEGPVTVSLSVIDVTDPAALASMPGDFSAVGEDGSAVYLQSLGAAWVGATDESGRELAVREGSEGVGLDLRSTATADMGKLGADAEMWTFNEASGKWELVKSSTLKVDGQVAPNSAARAAGATAAASAASGPKKKGGFGKKKGMKYKEYDDLGGEDRGVIEGCMSPEAFKSAVARGGEKSLATNITKLGYINCDLAYHHPQRAVMLTGVVLGADRKPLRGLQLWSVGRDYQGRCPDVSKEEGKFGALISQFDSSVDVEVHAPRAVEGDDKIEVFFENKDWFWKVKDNVRKLMVNVAGKYAKSDAKPLTWCRPAKKCEDKDAKPEDAEKDARIVWCQARRQWQAVVGDEPVFVRAAAEDDEDGSGGPLGPGWRLAHNVTVPGCEKIPPPTFAKPIVIDKQTFGPFKTGPPGEFVDLGELVVK